MGARLLIQKTNYRNLFLGGWSQKYLAAGHGHINDLLDERRPSSQSSGNGAPEMVVRYIDSKGVARCKGGRDLKTSQHYPRRFLVGTSSTLCRGKVKLYFPIWCTQKCDNEPHCVSQSGTHHYFQFSGVISNVVLFEVPTLAHPMYIQGLDNV